MALIDKAAQKQGGTDIKEQINLATQVVRDTLYDEDSAEQLLQVVQNANSVGAGLGKALMMAGQPIANEMHKKEPGLSYEIWLMEGGVVDNILAELADICEEAGIPVEDEDLEIAKETIAGDLQAMLEQGNAQAAPQGAPAQQAPPQAAPQGAPMGAM